MIVTCEACFTSFNLKDELIKSSGSKVRCSKCHKVFKVFPFVSEDISPPLNTELSDNTSKYSLSSPLFQTPLLDEPGVQQMPAPDLSTESPALPVDFKDTTEFDFPELDKLLQEENKGGLDELTPDFEAPVLLESKAFDLITAKTDKTFEQDSPEISLDESFDGEDDQLPGVDLETEIKKDFSELKPRDLTLDDFEESLEMDFSDISLVTTDELETDADQKKEVVDSETKLDRTSEDVSFSEEAFISFEDIEALDLSDIESLIEKQEISASALNGGVESFQRADSVISPLSTSSTETGQTLEMEDHYLTFDELQLDKGDSESATLLGIKESFRPHLSEISSPPTTPSRQTGPTSLKVVSEDNEMGISDDAVFDEELMDMSPAPKKRISPMILIALILAVIGAVAYGGYMLLNSMGIPIPFISQKAPSKVSDPGNLNIKPFDISSKFVDNVKIGKLFVVTGKVKNEYPMPRGAIQITGKLYTKDKTLAKSETIFCGNILSDMDLANTDAATFQQRLQNRSGDNRINQKVLPGEAIPFMIVFSNLPENLEEYTTEVINSVAS